MSDCWLCPECQNKVDNRSLACKEGHSYSIESGVLRLMKPDFLSRIETLEAALAKQRAASSRPALDPGIYDHLPDALADNDNEWRVRAEDAQMVESLLPSGQSLSILDLGAWNGWLSHRMATRGHSVLAADFFLRAPVGLAAKQYYTLRFDAVQIDLADLTPIGREFDIVVVNHGLAYFGHPASQLREALSRVRSGGTLVVLGLQFFRRTSTRAKYVGQMQADFEQQFKTELFIRQTRGLLDSRDRRELLDLGLTIRPYSCMRTRNILARLDGKRPYSCYGIMRKLTRGSRL